MRIWIVALAAALSGCIAHRSPQAANTPAGVDKAKIAKARKAGFRIVEDHGTVLYCRKESVTGSYIRQTNVCLTEAQWKRESEDAQRAADDISRVPRAKGVDAN